MLRQPKQLLLSSKGCVGWLSQTLKQGERLKPRHWLPVNFPAHGHSLCVFSTCWQVWLNIISRSGEEELGGGQVRTPAVLQQAMKVTCSRTLQPRHNRAEYSGPEQKVSLWNRFPGISGIPSKLPNIRINCRILIRKSGHWLSVLLHKRQLWRFRFLNMLNYKEEGWFQFWREPVKG